MKTLAIRGHNLRGKEVIDILEMLGGKNVTLEGIDIHCFYYIDTNNNLIRPEHTNYCNPKDFIIFTLEEFLEKYPYKVGDKVLLKHDNQRLCTIEEMGWNNKEGVVYSISFNEGHSCWYSTDELLPYKEEIKAEDRLEIYANHAIDNDSKTEVIINGEKLIVPNGYIVKKVTTNSDSLIVEYVKNKPQYPKTYVECSQIINKVAKTTTELNIAYNPNLIYDFQKLLICRDAYWKIAGEEMGLSEPWKPDLTDVKQDKYAITNVCNKIQFELYGTYNGVLVFPTKEMRDAFFKNFKDLIEKCKEFL